MWGPQRLLDHHFQGETSPGDRRQCAHHYRLCGGCSGGSRLNGSGNEVHAEEGEKSEQSQEAAAEYLAHRREHLRKLLRAELILGNRI
ncbi:hypothetical protein GJAV_G00195560 [Gymnothorax javanicus]|nr:hypothetical protein GJAV_G00195560 [Gymnothorax javanicus]